MELPTYLYTPKHPSRWLPPSRESKIEQGMTRLSTLAKRGGIWTDAWVACMIGL